MKKRPKRLKKSLTKTTRTQRKILSKPAHQRNKIPKPGSVHAQPGFTMPSNVGGADKGRPLNFNIIRKAVTNEVARLYADFKDADMLPKTGIKSFTDKGTKYSLTAEQVTKFQRSMGLS